MSAVIDTPLQDRNAGPREEWLQFLLDDQSYGLNVLQIQEILYGGLIEPVPGSPPHVLGVINLRGSIVTVVDTRMRLGLESREPGASEWIVVLDVLGETLGLMVDEVLEVHVFNPDMVEKMAGSEMVGHEAHVSGVIELESIGMLILLDAASISGLRREDG
ncbi:MAG: chemotaxis protein CheW [Wenzhouxiangella sp.]|jgi:purine-binding chemotaxis protein CheW|nr:chemotaxis protein CheW [Wenzhouxiangella sp.]